MRVLIFNKFRFRKKKVFYGDITKTLEFELRDA